MDHPSALNSLLRELLRRADEAQRAGLTPRVAFDCDQTLIDGDIGEATLASLTLSGELPTQAEWWSPLKAVLGQEGLQSLFDRYEQARRSGAVPVGLFQALWRAYEALCEAHILEGYLFAATVWYGAPASQLTERCEEVAKRALTTEVRACPKTGGVVSRGVRVRPVMRSLVRALQGAGVEVWVVSSSQRGLVQAIAPYLDIPSARVLGIDLKLEQGRSGLTPVEPCPVAEGKSQRFISEHGAPPIGMLGDSRYDLPLMRTAGWGALIDHGQPVLAQLAQEEGFHVIPSSVVSTLG